MKLYAVTCKSCGHAIPLKDTLGETFPVDRTVEVECRCHEKHPYAKDDLFPIGEFEFTENITARRPSETNRGRH